MKQALLFLLIIISTTLQAAKPWPQATSTEVRAYAWPNDRSTEKVILSGMTPKPGAINPEGALLSADQTKRLLGAVNGPRPKVPRARCFIPHNAFVFYNAAHQPVAYVEICFGCLNYTSSPEGAARTFDLLAIAAIFDELKLRMGSYRNLKAFEKHYRDMERLGEEQATPSPEAVKK